MSIRYEGKSQFSLNLNMLKYATKTIFGNLQIHDMIKQFKACHCSSFDWSLWFCACI